MFALCWVLCKHYQLPRIFKIIVWICSLHFRPFHPPWSGLLFTTIHRNSSCQGLQCMTLNPADIFLSSTCLIPQQHSALLEIFSSFTFMTLDVLLLLLLSPPLTVGPLSSWRYLSFPGRTWCLRNLIHTHDSSSLPGAYHSRLCVCVSALSLNVQLPSCYWHWSNFFFSLKLVFSPVFSNPMGGSSTHSPPETYKTSLKPPSFPSSVSSWSWRPLGSASRYLLKSLSSPSPRTPLVQTIISSLYDYSLQNAPPCNNHSFSIYLNLHPAARETHVKMQIGSCLSPSPIPPPDETRQCLSSFLG